MTLIVAKIAGAGAFTPLISAISDVLKFPNAASAYYKIGKTSLSSFIAMLY